MTEPLYRKLKNGRYQEITAPTEAIPLNDDQKAVLLTIALAAFETVRASEEPKTARYIRMTRAIDRILEPIDIYRLQAWPDSKVNKAANLVDIFNAMIAVEFGKGEI